MGHQVAPDSRRDLSLPFRDGRDHAGRVRLRDRRDGGIPRAPRQSAETRHGCSVLVLHDREERRGLSDTQIKRLRAERNARRTLWIRTAFLATSERNEDGRRDRRQRTTYERARIARAAIACHRDGSEWVEFSNEKQSGQQLHRTQALTLTTSVPFRTGGEPPVSPTASRALAAAYAPSPGVPSGFGRSREAVRVARLGARCSQDATLLWPPARSRPSAAAPRTSI